MLSWTVRGTSTGTPCNRDIFLYICSALQLSDPSQLSDGLGGSTFQTVTYIHMLLLTGYGEAIEAVRDDVGPMNKLHEEHENTMLCACLLIRTTGRGISCI
jgi:hypothetical protein